MPLTPRSFVILTLGIAALGGVVRVFRSYPCWEIVEEIVRDIQLKSKMEGLHPEVSPPSGESTAEPRMTGVRNDLEAGAALVAPVSLRTSAGRARPMVQGEDS